MKQWLTLFLVCVFAVTATAQVTPIRDIQFTEDEGGDSPLVDQVVTISGIVTAEVYAFGGSRYWVQDADGAWNGILVYDENTAAEGDSVTLTGTVSEYYGMTQVSDVTEFTIEADSVFSIQPSLVTTGEVGTGGDMAEAYEGCLVTIQDLTITNADLGYGEWSVDDGSGECRVDDGADYYFDPADYLDVGVQSITGVMDYSFSERKLQPRLAYDIIEGGKYTRLQRVQQVRYSDLLKTPEDYVSDYSYLLGDTITVTGVVTMPTGLSYAGEGIKFILGDPNGGPWSAILSYNEDSTAYPSLFEGDVIEMTGYIEEFTRGNSNMTEMFITSPIDIVNFGAELPPVDSVGTGDLRWPTTAEQWGNVMVKVEDAVVEDVDFQYYMFSVNDGSGSMRVYADSDSVDEDWDPPVGAKMSSIRGWVYHHFGSYDDSTTYKLTPLYMSDFVIGDSPPTFELSQREKAYASSSESMKVMTSVQTNDTISSVKVMYKVNDGEYNEVELTETDGMYVGEIPPQSAGSLVHYYFHADDSQGKTATDPSIIENRNYLYVVKDDPITIKDIQYSPWPIADSPFNGFQVEVEGYVTADTLFYNQYNAYVIQDEQGPWNGVYVFGELPQLMRGQKVKVFGTVTDYNDDWHSKWDNNTVILTDSVQVMDETMMIDPVLVQTGDIPSAPDAMSSEQYEGSLVRVEDLQLVRCNSYDVTVTDGSGECLLDADGFVGRDQDANPYFYIDNDNDMLILNGSDTLRAGDTISSVEGVFTFSFGTYKIEIRDMGDIGGYETGVNSPVVSTPLTYELQQNFPNPFNPETRLYFSLPETQDVQLVIYNMLGQKVRTLVDERVSMGRHVVNWDGRNDAGVLVPTGIYIYRIKAGDFIDHKKMTLMK